VKDPRRALGQRVQKYRQALRVSQEELADRAGLHRTYIGHVERGETNISLLNLLRLAEALKRRPQDLVRDLDRAQ